MKYNYKDLGLVNTKEMFAKANKEGYSVPAFNFNNLEQLQGIIEACVERLYRIWILFSNDRCFTFLI